MYTAILHYLKIPFHFWVIALFIIPVIRVTAQPDYSFASSSGSYTSITGGTVWLNGSSPSMDDVVTGPITIPSFVYDCNTYTSIYITTNGFITFGSAPSSSAYTPISGGGGYDGAVSPFGADLNKAASGSPEIRYEDVTASNEFVIQWKDMTRYSIADRISFQIRLNYSINTIKFVYGGTITAAATTPYPQVGLRGSSNASYLNRTTTTDWSATTAGGANNVTCQFNGSVKPAAGQTYTWTQSSMTYSSCTTVQSSTSGVTKCDIDQDVICVRVVTAGGCGSPFSLTQFNLGAGGSTSATLADVSTIHIYYTGTTNAFSNTNEFVDGGTVVSGGSHTITGSQVLSSGTNYFWIAYDIKSTATTANVVDASCAQITVAGVNRTPTTTSPAGTRAIAVCTSYPGTSALGLKHWLKSDAGVTGNPVSSWGDQSGAAITGSMTQGTASYRPSVQSAAINYQNYIRFDGSDDILISANAFMGTIYDATDNTIFMIKNYKSGTVDYKWQDGISGAYRMGMELSGGTIQRIDFANNLGSGGQNDLSTTDITNKDVMVEYSSDASSLVLKLNGNTDATTSHSLTFSPGTSEYLNIGGDGAYNTTLYCEVDIAEVMAFNKKLTATEFRRVESYLAIKYGITLGNNQGTGSCFAYQASDGTQVWNGHAGYHNYVIGIGRDNAAGNSGLAKTKSTSVSSLNGSTDIIAISNSDFTTPVAFSNDKAFLLVGSDAGSLSGTAVSYTHAGTAIQAQLSRTWVTQKTGTPAGGTNSVVIEVNMSLVNGSNANSAIRLLVDDNTSFGNGSGGEHVYSPNAGYAASDGKIYFTVPYAHIQSGTGYFTIASANRSTAPLPIELLSFTAVCTDGQVAIDWATATEKNNNYFTVEKTRDGVNYEPVARVNGAGNSSYVLNYRLTDTDPYQGVSYYRLKQTDYNDAYSYSYVVPAACDSGEPEFTVYPTPSFGNFNVFFKGITGKEVLLVVRNMMGEEFYSKGFMLDEHSFLQSINLSGKLIPGIYIVIASSDDRVFNRIITIQ